MILFSILISRAFKAREALVCAVHRRCPQLCRLFTFSGVAGGAYRLV